MTRQDRNRPKCKPPAILPADCDRRKGDLPHDVSIDFGDQRDGQCVIGPQGFDDQMFGLVAVGMVGKCGDQDFSDRIVVAGCFGTDNHGTSDSLDCLLAAYPCRSPAPRLQPFIRPITQVATQRIVVLVVIKQAVFLAWACMIAGTGALVAGSRGVPGESEAEGQDMSRLFSAVKKWLGLESAPYRIPTLDQTEAERVVDRLIDMGCLSTAEQRVDNEILFLHGWQSTPGGIKPTYLKDHGHEVLNPALPDDDFDAAVRIAQAEFDRHQPDVVVGSSRGGAVAMNINSGSTPLVLLCPAWKRGARPGR